MPWAVFANSMNFSPQRFLGQVLTLEVKRAVQSTVGQQALTRHTVELWPVLLMRFIFDQALC